MEPDRESVVLDADGTYYREWAQDLLSREALAVGGYNEHDWQVTRDACKIVLISNN
jgi:hypothetical protein